MHHVLNRRPARGRSLAPVSCLVLALGMLSPAVASARETGTPAAPPAETEARSDIVVTARRNYVATDTGAGTKSGTPLIETPQAISIVTQDQIQLLQIQNLEQATRYASGVVSGSYGPDSRFDWLTLRGFTPTLYLDGLQLPTAAVAEAQSRLDTFGVEQIEIVKGPSSALYGSVPPGGFVGMVSKRPKAKAFAEVSAQYGSFNHWQGSFDGGTPLAGGNLLLRLTTLFRDTDAQVNFAHERRFFIAPAVTWKMSPTATLTVLAHYQFDHDNTTIQYLPSQGTLLNNNPNGRIPTSFYSSDPDHDIFRRRTYDIGYDFNWKISHNLTFHQNVKYTKLDVLYDSIYAQGFVKGPDGVTPADFRNIIRYTYLVRSSPHDFGSDSHLEYKVHTGPIEHQFLVGVDYRHQVDNSALGFDVGPTVDLLAPIYHRNDIVDPQISIQNFINQDQIGTYAQDHAKLGAFAITGSLRHDWVRTNNRDAIANVRTKQSDKAWSGRIGGNLLLGGGLAPYASYSKSFTPTIGFAFDGQPFKPSRGTSYEAGLKYQPTMFKGLFTVSVYQITLDNALTPDPNPLHLGSSIQSGQIRSRGVEVEGTARINDALSLNVAYSYTDATTTRSTDPTQLGKRILLVPKTAASALADYTIRSGPLFGLGFGAGIRYVGNVYGDPTNAVRTNSFTLVDALAHYDLEHWRFALNANNLFDKTYLTSCYSFDSCTYGTRRTILFTASYRI